VWTSAGAILRRRVPGSTGYSPRSFGVVWPSQSVKAPRKWVAGYYRTSPGRCAIVALDGYEGLVAKDEASPYEGVETRRWLKVKQKNWTVEEDRWRRRIFEAETTSRHRP
jgi:hypothetical protein